MRNVVERVRATLMLAPDRWRQLLGVLPGEVASQRPVPHEWSARECLLHLLETERLVFLVRVRAFLDGEDLVSYEPSEHGGADTGLSNAELVAEFTRLRGESLALLASVLEDDLARTVTHPELGPVTLGQQLNEWATHDLAHIIQAERALAYPFLIESGPWQPSFADMHYR